MRLWHKDLINYLPKGQLLSQWKELNSIFKNQNKHILINDVYKYHKVHLLEYSFLVIKEMYKRHFKINSFEKMSKYFSDEFPLIALILSSGNLPKDTIDDILAECNYEKLFYKNHTEDYLVKCYFNLKEKYDCGQKDFSQAEWQAIEDKFVKEKEQLAERKEELEEEYQNKLDNLEREFYRKKIYDLIPEKFFDPLYHINVTSIEQKNVLYVMRIENILLQHQMAKNIKYHVNVKNI